MITITTGEFTIDSNGKQWENAVSSTTVRIEGGTVRFIDSNSEQNGTIKGKATAVGVDGLVNVCIESGNYQADTWAITTPVNASTSEPTLEIKGGTFTAKVAVDHLSGNLTISGGNFNSSGQVAHIVDDEAYVRGGTITADPDEETPVCGI